MNKIIIFLVILVLIGINYSIAKPVYQKDSLKDNMNIYAKNNDLVSIILSEKELNRINLKGEKINALHYTEGDIEFSIAESDLYLKVKVAKPVNFFIKTESGKTYQILAVTADVPSLQYFIQQKSILKSKSHKNSSKNIDKKYSNSTIGDTVVKKELTAYEKEINKIIKVIDANKSYMGYQLRKVSKRLYCRTSCPKGLIAQEISIARGNGLIAHKIIITNNSAHKIAIMAEDFENNYTNVIASYLEKSQLEHGEQANLIIVRE